MRKNVYKSRQTKKPKVLAVNKSSQKMMVRCESAVNKDAVRREVIDGVEHVIIGSYTLPFDIIMNGGKYEKDEILASFHTLEGTLAPIEHPVDSDGNFLPATSAEAIHNFHGGAWNVAVEVDDERIHLEKRVNVVEAMKSDRGKRLLERIEELEANDNPRPIHTSTGVFLVPEILDAPMTNAAGEEYTWIARDMTFDHDAILLDSVGAAQPHQGVGMAVNSTGETFKSERYFNADMSSQPTPDSEELSHDEIRNLLTDAINQPPYMGGWVQEVYADTFIFESKDQLFSAPYKIENGAARIVGMALTVERDVTYNPKTNNENGDVMFKKAIVNALKAAGVEIEGLDDAALLAKHNELQATQSEDDNSESNDDNTVDLAAVVANALKPLSDRFDKLEAQQNAQQNEELDALAAAVVNSGLYPDMGIDDAKLLPIATLNKLAANGKSSTGIDAFKINSDSDGEFSAPAMPE